MTDVIAQHHTDLGSPADFPNFPLDAAAISGLVGRTGGKRDSDVMKLRDLYASRAMKARRERKRKQALICETRAKAIVHSVLAGGPNSD